jgi:hypothetical protein
LLSARLIIDFTTEILKAKRMKSQNNASNSQSFAMKAENIALARDSGNV